MLKIFRALFSQIGSRRPKRLLNVPLFLFLLPITVSAQIAPYVRTGSGPGSYTFTLTNSTGTGNIQPGVVDIIQALAEATQGGGPTGPAVAGDTIVFQDGTYNLGGFPGWGAQPAAGVTITSQHGPTATVIDCDGHGETNYGVILLNTNCVLSGLAFVTATSTTIDVLSSVGSGWRVTNCTYTDSGGSASYFFYINRTSGVIDNTTITGTTASGEWVFIIGPDNAWQSSDATCRSNAVYIEHCTFNGPGYVMDNNSSGCCVVRFCTITGITKVDAHGYASDENGSPPRGCRLTDVYCNTWTANFGGNPTSEIRGGTGMWFDNTSASSSVNIYFEDYGYQGHWSNFSQIEQTPTNYPIHDQIGVGEDTSGEFSGGAGSDPLYCWGNTAGGSPWLRVFKQPDTAPTTGPTDVLGAIPLYQQQISNPSYYFTEDEIIREDRDLFTDLTVSYTLNNATNYNGYPSWSAKGGSPTFNGTTGVGVGSTVQMNATTPTKTGVGFWCTDQGAWNQSGSGGQGEFYVWNGSAWVLKYTPYQYPFYGSGPSGTTLTVTGNATFAH